MQVMCTRRHTHPISNKQFEVFTCDICDLQPNEMTPTLPQTPLRGGEEWGERTQDAELNNRTEKEELSDPKKGDQPSSPREKGEESDLTGTVGRGHLEPGVAKSLQREVEGGGKGGQPPTQQCSAVVDVGTQATEVCERGCSPLPVVWDVAVNTVEAETGDSPGDSPLHPPVEDRGTCTEWPTGDPLSPGAIAANREDEGEGKGFSVSAGGAGRDEREDSAVEAEEKLSGTFRPPQSSTPIPPEHSTSEHSTSGLVWAPPHTPSIVTERVLARWSMDRWYRRALVVRDNKDGRYLVMDDAGDSDVVARDDLVLVSKEPFQSTLPLGSFVVALHPDYLGVYGPAQVTAHIFGDQYVVLMFDGRTGKCARHEMFLVAEDTYTRDVRGIAAQQQEWVGQVVVARNDEDGFFYHGTIQQYSSSHFTIMSLQDGFLDTQKSDHVFGQAQKRRVIQRNDCIIAFDSGSTTSVGVPGQVIKCVGGKLAVELCHGAR